MLHSMNRPSRRWRAVALSAALSLGVGGIAGIALAPALWPAQVRADEPAAKPDLSSPRAAAKAFGGALQRGDATAAKAAAITNEQQAKLLDAMADVMKGMKKLNTEAQAKFGEKGKALAEDAPDIDISKEVDDAELKENGDTATLIPKKKAGEDKDPEPITLKKQGGDWKVDVGSVGKQEDMDKGIVMFQAMAKTATETADNVKAGKYKTVEEAKQDMGMKLMAAMMGGAPPSGATQPGTAPTPPAPPKPEPPK